MLGGLLVHSIGARKTFIVLACVSILNFIVYLVVVNCIRVRKNQKSEEN